MIYWIKIVWWSARWMFQINLGDLVWYDGNKHMVLNGVRFDSWRLDCVNNSDEGWVSRTDCKKVWTLTNMIGSFRSGYDFYMGYWYDIWKREGIKPWMKELRIWP